MIAGLKDFVSNYWLFLVLAAVLVAGFMVFRSRPTDLAGEEALNILLYDGQPAVIELYSNF